PVGGWNAEGAPMIRAGDGTYKINLSLPKGQTLEYKITRGMWETVEKGAGGEEIDNRTLKLDGDTTEKITVESWADRPPATAPTTKPKPKSTLTGDVRYHEHFHSNPLNNDRRILVWLPPRYDADKSARYPVLYLHDGQNVFD